MEEKYLCADDLKLLNYVPVIGNTCNVASVIKKNDSMLLCTHHQLGRSLFLPLPMIDTPQAWKKHSTFITSSTMILLVVWFTNGDGSALPRRVPRSIC